MASAEQPGSGPHWGRHPTKPHWEPLPVFGTFLSKGTNLKHAEGEKCFYLHEKHHRNEELNLTIAAVYFK